MKLKKIMIIVFILGLTTNAFSEEECFENASRAIFKFNEGLDRTIISPIAKGYNKLPEPIRKGTSNFTSNIGTLLSIPNHLLQGNVEGAGHALGSFMINSTIGVLGLADVASSLGSKDTKEDLSQTLGVYGVKGGCYFVIPVLGPSTARDAFAMIGDTFLDPFATVTWRQKEVLNISARKMDYVSVKGATAIDFRANNDKNFENLKKNSIDFYAATKSLYLQNKKRQINNSTSSQDEDWGNLDN